MRVVLRRDPKQTKTFLWTYTPARREKGSEGVPSSIHVRGIVRTYLLLEGSTALDGG